MVGLCFLVVCGAFFFRAFSRRLALVETGKIEIPCVIYSRLNIDCGIIAVKSGRRACRYGRAHVDPNLVIRPNSKGRVVNLTLLT